MEESEVCFWLGFDAVCRFRDVLELTNPMIQAGDRKTCLRAPVSSVTTRIPLVPQVTCFQEVIWGVVRHW